MEQNRNDDFKFDLNVKRIRISDDDLIGSVKAYAEIVGYRRFSTTEYDNWKDKKACSSTIIERLGSWRDILGQIGISKVQARKYPPEQLIDNLEQIWRELKHPPSKREIGKYGVGISERPYIQKWGSVRMACVALANYKDGKITEDELLRKEPVSKRRTIPLNIRWEVQKRDNYICVKCGKSPPVHHVALEVDHIIPVSKGGTNSMENLQTLCFDCNQGKKNRIQ